MNFAFVNKDKLPIGAKEFTTKETDNKTKRQNNYRKSL